MKFLKEYIRRHPADNQILIRVPEGTEASCNKTPGTFRVQCDRPVTKNSDSAFYMSKAEVSEYLGEA